MIYLWLLIILIIYIYIYYSDPMQKIDKMFPGPFRFPLFGNSFHFFTTQEGLYQKFLEYPKLYNYKTFRGWLLHKPGIVVTDHKVAKLILSTPSCIGKADEYKFFEPWLGKDFIFTGPEDKWKDGRKVITPAFHFKILCENFEVFDDNAKILCEKLEKHDGEDAFDVSQNIVLYALDNVCSAVMGARMQSQNDPYSDYVKAIKSMAKIIYLRILMFWLRSDTIFKLSPLGKLEANSLKTLHGYSYNVIRERKNQLTQSKVQNDDEKQTSLKQKKAFLDTLLENGQAVGFTDQEIRQTVDGIVFAGHDTVSTSLNFLLYALAEHQDVQEKVYKELERIFQNSDRCPTLDDLQEMKYTEQVIKETLRLYTVAPLVARKFTEDLYISKDQYIPKNMTVVILLGAIHRDPEVWPNPEKFDPERFSPEASQNRDPYTFLPFSAGPRNCLGQKFAIYEIKITLYRILRRYKLSLSDNDQDKIKIRMNFILTSANGFKIKVASRNINGNTEVVNDNA